MNKEQLEKNYPDLIKYYEEGDCCSNILKARKEIERLNNIINELEKYLIEEVKQPIVDPAEKEYIEGIKSALYKLQKLKGDDSNECKRDV